ncbi:hypothetical protein RI129_009177 [Pyrocoelia pectoralis]|uniref:Uncharacterized protein n=1 Tax=Pyrocoelia pectoralis TaxID=417401 RepID=A0AAN7ZED5_9COLE
MSRFLVIFPVILLACKAQLITKFQLCPRSDPNLNKCLKSAIQGGLAVLKNGVQEFDIPPLDHLKVPSYTVKAAPPLDFDQVYTDIKLHGHVSSEVKDVDVKITDTDFTLVLNMFTDEVTFECNYDYQNAIFDGIDMSGKGKTVLTVGKYSFTATFTGVISQYLEITKVTVTNVNIESAHFDYKSEDVKSGELLSSHFNEKWETLITKEKQKFIPLYEGAYKNEANAVFSKIPFDQLFPK